MDGSAIRIATTLAFETIDCYKCGVTFAVDATLRQNWKRDKTQFFCPNGHGQSYTESEADKLKRELAEAKRDAEWQKSRAATLDAQLQKERAATAKLKRRVNCGICPHCSRTFKQLVAHIKTKHPEAVTKLNRKPGEA